MPLISGQPKYPVSNLPQQTLSITTHIEAPAKEWIIALTDIEQDANLSINRKASFSAFYAEMYRIWRPCRDVSALIPLLK